MIRWPVPFEGEASQLLVWILSISSLYYLQHRQYCQKQKRRGSWFKLKVRGACVVSIVNCDHTRLIDYLLVVLKEFVPTHFHKLTSRPVLTPFSCAVRTNLLSQLQNMKQSLSQIMIDFPALKTVNSGAAPAAKHLRADSTTTAFTLESGHSRCSSIDSCLL